jgi:DNA polymerase-1
MSLLIDADYLAYKTCAACEDETDFGNDVIVVTSRFSEVLKGFEYELHRIQSVFDQDLLLFFSSPRNFRKQIDPDYKGHRNRKKPCGYKRLLNWCAENYTTFMVDGLEADDAIGIYATDPLEQEFGHIVVSPDKDMKQIPGSLYDLKEPVSTVVEEDAVKWFYMQVMSGDQTDGYSGVPGIGLKKAAAILEKNGCSWESVLDTFLAAGLAEEDALRNARLAKILQHSDYNHETNEPILWTPITTSSVGDDDGAAVQAAADEGSNAKRKQG